MTITTTSSKANRRVSVVDMLAKVPVNRGSLLTSVENLIKTIESSESAVMIPTLLRDKCDFDACELLFVAKILKASILGHSDLVEFYMNHVGHTTNHLHAAAAGESNQQQQQLAVSPKATRTLPGSPMVSPVELSNQLGSLVQSVIGGCNKDHGNASDRSSPANSLCSAASSSNTCTPNNGASSSDTSWATALSNDPVAPEAPAIVSQASEQQGVLTALATRPLLSPGQVRQPHPPSLLQLTTTNNHINSVAGANLDQLASRLVAIQIDGEASSSSEDGLSSTTLNLQQETLTAPPTAVGLRQATPPTDLRLSRSAGCLFRLNSPAQTPTGTTSSTPLPQAETLAGSSCLISNLTGGDPSAPVKLLLQIEQLKSSINHVTSLLESVVELYKESIDNIS